jgi:hypothetical protein
VTSGNIIAYLYQWINIRYADTADGGTNFSTSPTNRLYYGVRNSTTSTASSNPADYIWFEVAAGGFGTTKFLFYTSIGGNQIQFFVGTTAPNLFYEQTVDNTPIDLSVITTSIPTTTVNIFYPEGQFIVRGNNNVYTPPAVANVVTLVANVQALRQNQITAAVDQNIQYFTANGNYFITSNTSTAFNSNLFTFSSPYSSTYNVYQDVVYTDITGTITSFLSAALIVNDAAANVGPPGQRGSIPLGFVTTVNDPNTATTANLTTQFEAPRTNTTPPIGLGIGPPISGDTVQFFFPNLTAINGGITSVRTYDGNVWTPVTANVISGNVIYTGTITSQAMSTFDIFTLRIESTNSELGNVNAQGFWLDSISGDARFAGNTYVGNNLVIGNNVAIGNNASIGGNLSVTGLITAGALNANIVTTNQLVINSATQTISVADNTPYAQIQFVNGNSNPTSADFIWPNFTRGFAIGGGASILTQSNGSVDGSKISVNYNAYIFSETNPEYNVVELWKSGTSPFYSKVFQTVRVFDQQTFFPNVSQDLYSIVGQNGSIYGGNINNISQVVATTSNDLYDSWVAPQLVPDTATGGLSLRFGQSGATVFGTTFPTGAATSVTRGNIVAATTYSQITSGNAAPNFNVYGAKLFGQYSYFGAPAPLPTMQTLLVGSSGRIVRWSGRNQTTGTIYPFGTVSTETTGVFADLLDIEADIQSNIDAVTSVSTTNIVAVGTAGTILYNSRNKNFTNSTGVTWSAASSNVLVNLNSVKSNYTLTTQGNTWVAVGDAGTILRATSASGPWVLANSVPTTNNLHGVGYTNGYWVAVGDAGTIIYSTDGTNWSGPVANPADGSDPIIGVRNLYGVAGGLNSNVFVAAGEEIILRSNTSNPGGSWTSNIYLGGSSVNSTLTRLQFFGSFANVANTSLPPVQQRVTNGQVVSGTYTDINYVENEDITYYLVLGNMFGNVNVFTNGPNMTVTEFKR